MRDFPCRAGVDATTLSTFRLFRFVRFVLSCFRGSNRRPAPLLDPAALPLVQCGRRAAERACEFYATCTPLAATAPPDPDLAAPGRRFARRERLLAVA